MNWKTIAVFALSAGLVAASDVTDRLDAAALALREVMDIPEQSIPQDLLDKAECVVVVPDLKKGAFILGAQYGRGFFSCRNQDGLGWTAPGAIRVEGGSFGLQIGGSETDVFMLVMNEKGMDRLLSSQFTLGGEAQAAAGPVGRSTQAETDVLLTAEILTWSRSRGLFAGVSLKGSTLRMDMGWNEQLYGKQISNREIVTSGIAAPAAATELLAELNRYSSR